MDLKEKNDYSRTGIKSKENKIKIIKSSIIIIIVFHNKNKKQKSDGKKTKRKLESCDPSILN